MKSNHPWKRGLAPAGERTRILRAIRNEYWNKIKKLPYITEKGCAKRGVTHEE